jgi:hypothetical protein
VKRATDKIMAALRAADPEKLSSVELQKRSGVTMGFYPWLAELEQRGLVHSEFQDGPYPRLRLYGISSARTAGPEAVDNSHGLGRPRSLSE